ncbi:putative effector of murein hydrolase [Bacillus mesophilus]|uniref:hypothetical protein n=1 Tax=Bacillus mesophilus TaxID=1808955 RepID=UPI0013D1CFA4|nr:hypothetical protein [Bacillus mesophilus]MBM7659743.1 putative effector of murein hydrolase [Bacillus mesophilus]
MNMKVFLAVLAFLVAFYFQLLGMMNLVPLLVTTPILFLVLLLISFSFNNRNRFKGFKG